MTERVSVLLVDDEADFVFTLAERLKLRGFQVIATTKATDVMSKLKDSGIRVVLLDVKMPGIDGLKLMSEIKREQPDLQIISGGGLGGGTHDLSRRHMGYYGESPFEHTHRGVSLQLPESQLKAMARRSDALFHTGCQLLPGIVEALHRRLYEKAEMSFQIFRRKPLHDQADLL